MGRTTGCEGQAASPGDARRSPEQGNAAAGRVGLKKLLLMVAGFLCLALAVVGVVLPVLPTTPFALLAAACFSLSSIKLHAWLLRNRVVGPYIENYKTGNGISKVRKIGAMVFLWVGLAVSMAIVRTTLICIILSVVGVTVTVHLLTLKTKE